MTRTLEEERRHQMNEMNEEMKKQAKFWNKIIGEPVPVPMRILWRVHIEYLHSEEFAIDYFKTLHNQ